MIQREGRSSQKSSLTTRYRQKTKLRVGQVKGSYVFIQVLSANIPPFYIYTSVLISKKDHLLEKPSTLQFLKVCLLLLKGFAICKQNTSINKSIAEHFQLSYRYTFSFIRTWLICFLGKHLFIYIRLQTLYRKYTKSSERKESK